MCREGSGFVAAYGGVLLCLQAGKEAFGMYQALYRKWRPKTFSEVVGQAHITDTLQRQVAEGRTAHAYLFTGTRGTGKTTCARILAKAINCRHPVDGAPCNCCDACRGIDEGTLLDVTELDAASNSGVDYVRALREEAVYTPAVLQKRVYIIDEVHMLTREAFNALLKILEEPPAHLVFILATTELHKVPATILSRCQRFSFKRILPRDIEEHLLHVAQAENIPLTADGAEILARMANGALRDALSLLDQCRVADGALDSRAVLDVLGLAGSVQTVHLMRHILARDSGQTLALFDQLYRDGKDVSALLGELLDLSRDLTMVQAAPEGAASLLTGVYDRKTLTALGQGESMHRFLYLTSTLQRCCSTIADSYHPRTEAELCLLRLCDESLSGDLDALVQRVEHLEQQLQNGVVTASAPSPTPAAKTVPASRPSRPASARAAAATPTAAQTVPATVRQEDPAPSYHDFEEPPLPEEPPLREEERIGRERVFDIREDTVPVRSIPPVRETAAAPVPTPRSAPAPAAEAAPASSGADTAIWGQLIDHYKGRLPVNHRVFLNMASGALEDDCLTVYCNNDFVRDSLDHPSVVSVLQEVTSGAVGHSVRVQMTVGKAPASGGGAPRRTRVTPMPAPAPAPASTPAAVPAAPRASVAPAPKPQPAAPAQTPPWEEPSAAKDKLDEIMDSAQKLDHFKIK